MNLLANMLLKPFVLLLAAWTPALLMRRASASLCSALLTAGIISAALLPLASLGLPHWNLRLLGDTSVEGPQSETALLATASAVVGPLSSKDAAQRFAPADVAKGDRLPPRMDLLGFALWLCGFIFFSGRLALGIRAAHRIQRTARRAGPIADSNVQVLLVDGFCPPMTWGIIRRVILMPAASEQWSAEQRDIVIAHELAHVQRHDWLMQVFSQLACSVYWFNPMMWIAAARLRQERECACDDRVLAGGTSPADYATHLLDVARIVGSTKQIAAIAVGMAQPSHLEIRLRAILDPMTRRKRITQGSLVLLTTVALAVTILASSLNLIGATSGFPPLPFPPKPPEFEPGTPSTATKQTPERNRGVSLSSWADAEVRYIISPAEKAAFIALLSDADRERFIAQFWQSRNPQPGSSANAYEEEYYQRVEYANAHFGFLNHPGWISDRGRIYITYGKPDEIESHASGGSKVIPSALGPFTLQVSHPYETWIYRKASEQDATYEFHDRSQNGEFPLENPNEPAQSMATIFGHNGGTTSILQREAPPEVPNAVVPKNNPSGIWESASGTRYDIRLDGRTLTVKRNSDGTGPFSSYDVTLINDANEVNTYRGSGTFMVGPCTFATQWQLIVVSANQILGSTSDIERTAGTCNMQSQFDPPDPRAARLDLKRK